MTRPNGDVRKFVRIKHVLGLVASDLVKIEAGLVGGGGEALSEDVNIAASGQLRNVEEASIVKSFRRTLISRLLGTGWVVTNAYVKPADLSLDLFIDIESCQQVSVVNVDRRVLEGLLPIDGYPDVSIP